MVLTAETSVRSFFLSNYRSSTMLAGVIKTADNTISSANHDHWFLKFFKSKVISWVRNFFNAASDHPRIVKDIFHLQFIKLVRGIALFRNVMKFRESFRRGSTRNFVMNLFFYFIDRLRVHFSAPTLWIRHRRLINGQ